MYESQISFTLDTICPWTFLAKKRLDKALAEFRSSESSAAVSFSLHFEPYQLNPDLPESTDRAAWYLENEHLGDSDSQVAHQVRMAALAEPLGKTLNFTGPTGNTFQAHRLIQHFQEKRGAETANRLVDALFDLYFTKGKHPAADETLVEACVEAGIDEKEAKEVVEDREEGERDLKMRLREVTMDADAVPIVMVEGKRRDLTLTGAKEIADYVKALNTVTKESV